MDYLAPASASASAAEEEDAETAEEEEEEEESESDPVSESEDEPDELSESTRIPSLRKNDGTQPLLAESFRGALRSLGTCLSLRLVLLGLGLPLRVQLTVHKSQVPQPVVAHVAAVLGVEVTEYGMAPFQPSCRGVKLGELLPDHTERVIRIREDEVPKSVSGRGKKTAEQQSAIVRGPSVSERERDEHEPRLYAEPKGLVC